MVKLYTTLFSLFLVFASSAQYCTAVGPGYAEDSNLGSFDLSGESATAISYTGSCPGVIGLNDQTLIESVTLAAGNNYNAFVSFATCGGVYGGAGQAWIDYNQNQVFEASESIGTWAGSPPSGSIFWNFTVPAGASSGLTRMRVVHYESGSLPLDPCASFAWGSTVDFTVQIGGGIDCSAYVGESISDPRIVASLPYSESYNNTICYSNVQTAYASPDVFYRVLPQQLGVDFLNISLCGSSFDTWLAVLDADGDVLWYNDDDGSCATGSEITIATGNHDTLYIAVQGWGSAAGDYDIAINQQLTGIENNSADNVLIYPNPANEKIFIQTNSTQNVVMLYDLAGHLVHQQTSGPNESIDGTAFAAGTYFISVANEKGQFIQKIVIE